MKATPEMRERFNKLQESTEGKQSEDWTLDEIIALAELWRDTCLLNDLPEEAAQWQECINKRLEAKELEKNLNG